MYTMLVYCYQHTIHIQLYLIHCRPITRAGCGALQRGVASLPLAAHTESFPGDDGRDAQPALVIGRHCITERDSAPVQYNGIV